MDLEDFDVNDELSLEGTWVPLGKGAELRVARMGNENYTKFINKKTKPFRAAIRAQTVDDSLMLEFVIQGMARHVLLDWKGMKEKGVETSYSVETAERWLREKEPFRNLVAQLAQDAQLFQQAETEDAVKN